MALEGRGQTRAIGPMPTATYPHRAKLCVTWHRTNQQLGGDDDPGSTTTLPLHVESQNPSARLFSIVMVAAMMRFNSQQSTPHTLWFVADQAARQSGSCIPPARSVARFNPFRKTMLRSRPTASILSVACHYPSATSPLRMETLSHDQLQSTVVLIVATEGKRLGHYAPTGTSAY